MARLLSTLAGFLIAASLAMLTIGVVVDSPIAFANQSMDACDGTQQDCPNANDIPGLASGCINYCCADGWCGCVSTPGVANGEEIYYCGCKP